MLYFKFVVSLSYTLCLSFCLFSAFIKYCRALLLILYQCIKTVVSKQLFLSIIQIRLFSVSNNAYSAFSMVVFSYIFITSCIYVGLEKLTFFVHLRVAVEGNKGLEEIKLHNNDFFPRKTLCTAQLNQGRKQNNISVVLGVP